MKAAKRLYRPHAFITVPENCLDPTRDHFSFNYVFHVCVPKLHPQRASPVFHTHPHLQHSVLLPVKTGLQRVCPARVCIHVLLHLYNVRVISVLKVCFSKHTVKHVPVLWPLYI